MTTTAVMVAEKAIAQLAATLAKMALTAEQGRHEAATREKVLADKTNKQCWAAAREKALADDTNKQHRAAAQEKVLADKANEQRRAAARDKALANEANERCRHESAERATTLATKVLAEDKHNEDDDNVARRGSSRDLALLTSSGSRPAFMQRANKAIGASAEDHFGPLLAARPHLCARMEAQIHKRLEQVEAQICKRLEENDPAVTPSAPSDITRVACPPGRLTSTANGSPNPVAAFTQRIEEACSHHDALISASVADFGSFATALDGPHPQMPSVDNEDDNDNAADIAIPPPHQPTPYVEAVMCISWKECHPVNAQENEGFLDIIIVQPPSQPTSYAEAVMSLLGGDHQPSTTTILVDIGSDHIRSAPHHTMVCRCNQPCCRPGHHRRPRAPNPLYDEAFPYLPQPTRGGISTSCAVTQHPTV